MCVCSREGAKVESMHIRVVGLSVYKMLFPFMDMSIHHDESIPPLPPPMPPLDELVQRNKMKIVTIEAAVNTNTLALKRRQRKQTQDLNEGMPICIEEHQSKQTVKMRIPQLELSSSDREILLSPTAWLTDSIIDAAQNLLKKACPVPGLRVMKCSL